MNKKYMLFLLAILLVIPAVSASVCTTNGSRYIFYDDFESGTVTSNWSIIEGTGVMNTTVTASGSYALQGDRAGNRFYMISNFSSTDNFTMSYKLYPRSDVTPGEYAFAVISNYTQDYSWPGSNKGIRTGPIGNCNTNEVAYENVTRYCTGRLAPTQEWSSIRIYFNVTDKVSVWLNDVKIADDNLTISLSGATTDMNYTSFYQYQSDIIYDEVAIYSGTSCISGPPTIDSSTYLCTDCYRNSTSWRTSTAGAVYSLVNTPTINFSLTASSANCSLGTSDLTYLNMIADDANTKCSTTETDTHSCTLPDSKALTGGLGSLYIACYNPEAEGDTSFESGALAISSIISEYPDNITETSTRPFNITFLFNSTETPIVYLTYNTTNYQATKKITGFNNATYNVDLILPLVLDASNETTKFFWNVTFSDGEYLSNNFNHTVYRLYLSNCTVPSTSTTYAINFTILDEITNNTVIADLDSVWSFWDKDGAGTLTRNYSVQRTGFNNYSFCIYPSWANLTTDATIFYEGGDYEPREYSLSKYNVDNSTDFILLYLLGTANSTTFKLTVRDPGYIYYTDAIVRTLRYDVLTNSYIEVESCTTDDDGTCLTHLVLEDVNYKFMVVEDGTIIHLTSATRVYCPETSAFDQCLLTVLVPSSLTTYNYIWDDVSGLSYSIAHNNASNISSMTWAFVDGSVSYIRFKVTQDNLVICNTNSSAAAGIINCDLTGYNGTVKEQIFLSRSDELAIFTKYLDLTNIWETFGTAGVFFLMLIVITVATASVVTGSAVAAIILTIAALGISVATGIGGLSTAAFIMLAVAGAFIIFKLRQ